MRYTNATFIIMGPGVGDEELAERKININSEAASLAKTSTTLTLFLAHLHSTGRQLYRVDAVATARSRNIDNFL